MPSILLQAFLLRDSKQLFRVFQTSLVIFRQSILKSASASSVSSMADIADLMVGLSGAQC